MCIARIVKLAGVGFRLQCQGRVWCCEKRIREWGRVGKMIVWKGRGMVLNIAKEGRMVHQS